MGVETVDRPARSPGSTPCAPLELFPHGRRRLPRLLDDAQVGVTDRLIGEQRAQHGTLLPAGTAAEMAVVASSASPCRWSPPRVDDRMAVHQVADGGLARRPAASFRSRATSHVGVEGAGHSRRQEACRGSGGARPRSARWSPWASRPAAHDLSHLLDRVKDQRRVAARPAGFDRTRVKAVATPRRRRCRALGMPCRRRWRSVSRSTPNVPGLGRVVRVGIDQLQGLPPEVKYPGGP